MDTWLDGDCSIPVPPECENCCDRFYDADGACEGPCEEDSCASDCAFKHNREQLRLADEVLEDQTGADRSSCLKLGVKASVQRLVDRFSPRTDEDYIVRTAMHFSLCALHISQMLEGPSVRVDQCNRTRCQSLYLHVRA